MKNHVLKNVKNEKLVEITISDFKVITKTGSFDKFRISEKTFNSEKEASKFFLKKEWDALKKGFIYKSNNNNPGEYFFHYYIGGGYTGCLSLCSFGNNLAVYKSVQNGKDVIYLFDDNLVCFELIELPYPLAWSIKYNESNNTLVLDCDHYILNYSLKTKKFINLTKSFTAPASFIDIGNENIFYGSAPNYFVMNSLKQKIILNGIGVPDMYNRHSTIFNGAISKSGKSIAFINSEKEIKLINIKSKIEQVVNIDVSYIKQLQFFNNDSQIILLEFYNKFKLHILDLELKKIDDDSTKLLDEYSGHINYFCLNSDHTILAIFIRSNIFLVNCSDYSLIKKININHCVKTAEGVFLDNSRLAIRTDYGCLSVLNI